MKKIFFIFISLLLINFNVFADENKDYKLINITEAYLKNADILYSGGDAKLEKTKDCYEKKSVDDALDSVNPLVSFNQRYKNEIINMDMEFDFTGADGKTPGFDGFQLRAKTNDKRCWTTDCYVITVREDNIEIQVFVDTGNTYLLNRKCSVPKNKRVNVKVGAVDIEEGTYVFIQIDDEVYGGLDTVKRIKDEGYFNLEWRSGLKFYPVSNDENFSIPVTALNYDAKQNRIVSDVSYISNIKTENKDVAFEWYLSNDGFIKPEKNGVNLSESFTVIDGEIGDALLVMSEDIGKCAYARCTVDGAKINSDIIYISPVTYIMNKGLLACVGYCGAFKDGESFIFDKENKKIYADSKDGLSYLPVRGVAEKYVRPIKWDGETQTVYMQGAEYNVGFDTRFTIGVLGFGSMRGYMSSSMAGTPYIKENRAYIDSGAMAQILDYQYIFYDETSGIIALSPVKLSFNEKELSELVQNIEQVQ